MEQISGAIHHLLFVASIAYPDGTYPRRWDE